MLEVKLVLYIAGNFKQNIAITWIKWATLFAITICKIVQLPFLFENILRILLAWLYFFYENK